ncbi:hypothetical protein EBQ34_01295 [Vandammella animalimorsus]|uniref:Uncharacterized protein n=1 Tax=Vandammella animalimorsus TaxID=2029117 RepID=A0A3M6RVC4_9BURK|nr:hypothetical protein [Vandammella animalimorsus]RMX19018.1 hypothetical protein EBQ34_01295 [Vandammella animalimorsus]
MPITTNDIKLRPSKVMADVPEGGGGPAAGELESGVSNNIFPDITEVARVGGQLAHRQIHMALTNQDRDVAMGCNAIVSRPPTDPRVSIMLMATEGDFATRAQDMAKLQAGFIASGIYPGQLFGNHVSGQQVLLVQQREEEPPPTIGSKLALVYREGAPDEFIQYVSVQRVLNDVVRVFVDNHQNAGGEYKRRILTLELGQALQRDFPGFDARRTSIPESEINQRTKVRTTVWAPAGRYYGVKPLTAQAALGAFTVQAAGIYERLVPSSEAESPIADARVSAHSAAMVQSGNLLTYTTYAAFNLATNLYIGGGVLPGSLALLRGGQLLTDAGGRLLLGGQELGRIDYASGLCTLLAEGFPSGGPLQITYAPAVQLPQDVASTGIAVTAESRRLNYVMTLPFAVARGSVRVHYRAMERWYVLADDGSGALGDGDASHGAGSYNHGTRTLAVTLGALPDVGSAVIVQYVRDAALDDEGNHVDLLYPRLCIPINSDGQISTEPGSKPFTPGQVLIEWSVPGSSGLVQRSASDDGSGAITGDATGTVDYQAGRLVLLPDELPPMGTVITVKSVLHQRQPQTASWAGSGGQWSIALSPNIQPGTLRFPLSVTLSGSTNAQGWAQRVASRTVSGYVVGWASGQLVFHGVPVGSINHSAGTAEINITQGVANQLARTVGFELTRVGEVQIS